jgi:predicted PurR-regulated permease PerM
MADVIIASELHRSEPDASPAENTGLYVRKALGLTLLFALVAGCAVVLRPFLVAILWAAILVVSSWPFYCRVERLLGGRRSLAALLMTLALAAVLLVPLLLLGFRLAENVGRLAETIRSAVEAGPPAPPAWLADIPIAGKRLTATWLAASKDAQSLNAFVQDHIAPVRDWLLARGADVAGGLLQLSLSLLTAFFFYRDGPAILRTTNAIIARISGTRSDRFSETAGGTINGVVRGVLGTAIIQAILAGAGYWIAGVPGALFLGFLSFFLSLVPLGLALIWVPAAIWLASHGMKEWALFTAIWQFFIGTLDNFLRPWLIRSGSDLPFLLVLLGIVGGAVGFGLVGVFLGPTLLAIAYSLAQEWGGEAEAATDRPDLALEATAPKPSPASWT